MNLFDEAMKRAGGGPSEIPARPCSRCLALREKYPELVVQEVESFVGATGVVYHAATCRQCSDVEWSQRWAAKLAKAQEAGDADGIEALMRAKQKRVAAGRKVFA